MKKIKHTNRGRMFAGIGLVTLLTQLFLGSVAGATDVQVVLLEKPTSIVITPANPTIHGNDTQQFTATAIFAVGTNEDVTDSALTTWESDNTDVATIGSDPADLATMGLATGKIPGTVNISATYGGVTETTQLRVDGRSRQSGGYSRVGGN